MVASGEELLQERLENPLKMEGKIGRDGDKEAVEWRSGDYDNHNKSSCKNVDTKKENTKRRS
jgi:hypothetical protein